mgnify:CR=1 FL=1
MEGGRAFSPDPKLGPSRDERLDEEQIGRRRHWGNSRGRTAHRVAFQLSGREGPGFAGAEPPGRKLLDADRRVIGPDGENIHTDDHGRIKVRFHWDHRKDAHANQAIWARVVYPWAGNGWGWQSTPRIGTEVIVAFIDECRHAGHAVESS